MAVFLQVLPKRSPMITEFLSSEPTTPLAGVVVELLNEPILVALPFSAAVLLLVSLFFPAREAVAVEDMGEPGPSASQPDR